MVPSQIIIYIISFAMLSRVFSFAGLPSAVNFIHFPLVLILSAVILTKNKSTAVRQFLHLAIFFLGIITLSAYINNTGIANIILDFMILMEPLLMVFCIFSLKWSEKSIRRFRFWILFITTLHLAFILFQYFILGHIDDDVVGILLGMGAGSHLSGAIAMSAAIYFILNVRGSCNKHLVKQVPYFIFAALLISSVIFSDAKQVFAVFLMALMAVMLFTLSDLKKTFFILVTTLSFIFILYEASITVFPALQTWAKVDVLEEGLLQKLSVFNVITSFFDSFLNYLFGYGPGHTVGRLAMLLPDYSSQLAGLGVTTSPITSVAWAEHQGHYMSNSITGSSMFALFFSWAGVFGDLGFLGLSVYIYMYYMVWKMVSVDEFSKFLLLTIFIFGWVFQWMEEPQYMLFIMSLIGLRWQEIQLSNRLSGSNARL